MIRDSRLSIILYRDSLCIKHADGRILKPSEARDIEKNTELRRIKPDEFTGYCTADLYNGLLYLLDNYYVVLS